MKDLKQQINNVIKTGKIMIGSKSVITALLNSNLKLILLSDDVPEDTNEQICYYSRLADTPYMILKDNRSELGSICGKPFPVSVLGIVDPGDSDILNVAMKV